MKNVEFHFPYSQISLERVDETDVTAWQTWLEQGKSFTVKHKNPYSPPDNPTYTEYTINGEQVTYMQVKDQRPF